MKQQYFMDLLKQVDETTEDRIAEEFPVNWDKASQFEAVYQAYLKQSGAEPPAVPAPVSAHKNVYRMIAAAACLLLTVGLGVGVWSRQQKIEPLPPRETQTATVTETAETASETQPSTDTSPTKPETTASSQESDRMQTTVSEAALLTSAPHSSASAAPQTSVTKQGQIAPHASTIPCSTGAAETSSLLPTDQTECVTDPTQPPETQALTTVEPDTMSATKHPTMPLTEPSTALPTDQRPATTGVTEASEPSTELEQFPQFWVHWEDESMTRKVITYREFVQSSPDDGANSYTVSVEDSGKTFEVEQISRRIRFSVTCDAGAEVSCGTAGGHPCVWVSDGDRCTLYWDDGSFTFCIKGTAADRDTMEKIAGSMIPA